MPVSNLDRSAASYAKFAAMTVVQRLRQTADPTREVAWLSDLTRPFAVVLVETTVEHALGPFAHLGVACETKDEVARQAVFEAAPSERLANRQASSLI